MMEFEQHPTEPDTLAIKMPKRYIAKYSYEDLRAAVLAEREACARLCEQTIKESEISYKETKFEKQQRLLCLKMMEISANSIAEAIRARSKHD